MFRVENIESPRSGRPVANQFEVIMDTAVGRVVLFQSYETPIAMTVHCRVHNTTYYIATTENIQEQPRNIKKYFMKSMENT